MKTYELLIKGGEVIDPAQGIHDQLDIGISQRKIAALTSKIAATEAGRVINATGKIVTPGLIDIHTHIAVGVTRIGVTPDEAGVLSGVTTACDAGSTGYANFSAFKRFIIPQARTDVFCFLHLCPTGLTITPELWGWHGIDPQAMLSTIEENRDIIKGIKLRAIATVAENLGLEAVRVAKRVATEAGLPLLTHIGIDLSEEAKMADKVDAFTRELLPLLDNGDILSHVFTWKAGGIIRQDGSVLSEFREAIERGVVLDVACGMTNFSFEIAEKGLEQGILPDTLSTDITSSNINGPVFSLVVTMSKFFALGLTLEQVIRMTTINPARALGEERHRGSLRIGMPADISIMEMTEGDFLFSDGKGGNTLQGKLLLVPKLTLKSGVEIAPQPIGSFKPHSTP